MRLDLPDGAWAELYDATKVPERKRRPVVRALLEVMKAKATHGVPEIDNEALTDEDKAAKIAAEFDPSLIVAADDLNDAVIVALVREWSFGAVSEDVLLDLPADAYRALSDACGPLMVKMLPQFEVSPDPKAIGGSSS